MTIRKLNITEKAEVLSMMEVFYASDALLQVIMACDGI